MHKWTKHIISLEGFLPGWLPPLRCVVFKKHVFDEEIFILMIARFLEISLSYKTVFSWKLCSHQEYDFLEDNFSRAN